MELLPAVLYGESIHKEAENAVESLAAMGHRLDPLVWPDTADFSFVHESHESIDGAEVEIGILKDKIKKLETAADLKKKLVDSEMGSLYSERAALRRENEALRVYLGME